MNRSAASLSAPLPPPTEVDIVYSDAKDNVTARRISDWEDDCYERASEEAIVAYCHLRQEDRPFRLDRILEVTDPRTGKAVPDWRRLFGFEEEPDFGRGMSKTGEDDWEQLVRRAAALGMTMSSADENARWRSLVQPDPHLFGCWVVDRLPAGPEGAPSVVMGRSSAGVAAYLELLEGGGVPPRGDVWEDLQDLRSVDFLAEQAGLQLRITEGGGCVFYGLFAGEALVQAACDWGDSLAKVTELLGGPAYRPPGVVVADDADD